MTTPGFDLSRAEATDHREINRVVHDFTEGTVTPALSEAVAEVMQKNRERRAEDARIRRVIARDPHKPESCPLCREDDRPSLAMVLAPVFGGLIALAGALWGLNVWFGGA